MQIIHLLYAFVLLVFPVQRAEEICKYDDLNMMNVQLYLPPLNEYRTLSFPMELDCLNEYIRTVTCPSIAVETGFSCESLMRSIYRIVAFNTTWTDIGVSYVDFIQRAVVNEELFSSFKVAAEYSAILENCQPLEGLYYLWKIRHQSPDMLQDTLFLSRLMENNALGSPELIDYSAASVVVRGSQDGITHSKEVTNMLNSKILAAMSLLPQGYSTFSPSTIRYLGILSTIEVLFGVRLGYNSFGRAMVSTDAAVKENFNFRIAEIGVGYGGQAQAIFARALSGESYVIDANSAKHLAYYFFDLPAPLQLTAKYFGRLNLTRIVPDQLYFVGSVGADSASDGLDDQDTALFDLCISNFAFSEFSQNLQEKYVSRVLRRCVRGYMEYNTIGRDEHDSSLSAEEFSSVIRSAVTDFIIAGEKHASVDAVGNVDDNSKCGKVRILTSADDTDPLGKLEQYVTIVWDFSECIL